MNKPETATPVKCAECQRTYSRYRDLRRHVQKSHPDKLDLIAPYRKGQLYKFKCPNCHRNYNHKANLKLHFKKTHGVDNLPEDLASTDPKPSQKCALCDHVTLLKKDFNRHYEQSHDTKIETTKIQFASNKAFIDWKSDIETATRSRFVKEKGSKSGVNSYICHRSGFFKSESRGERRVKANGSNKINGYCPAAIKLFPLRGGKYLAEFVQTHVGHEKELHRLPLTSKERRRLGSQLASNASFDEIIDKTCEGASANERSSLITKKDLYNIRASLRSTAITKQEEEDPLSLDGWVNEMEGSYEREREGEGNNCRGNENNFEFVWDVEPEVIILEPMNESGSESSKKKSLAERKRERITNLSRIVNSINSEVELQAFDQLVKPIKPTLEAVRKTFEKKV